MVLFYESFHMERKLLFDNKGLTAFALQLKKIRKEKNITQEELAERAGITLSQVARIETIKRNPSLSTVFALAKGLDIPLKVLFDFEMK